MPCDLKRPSQDSRGTASMCTGRHQGASRKCCGDLVRCHAFAVLPVQPRGARSIFPEPAPLGTFPPMSAVATMGTGLSSGCRKLGITPCSRAGATSHRQFSMNQAGRRNVVDPDRLSAQRPFDNGVLRQEVRLTSLRPDRRKINHSGLGRAVSKCGAQCPFRSPAPRETLGCWIKVWRYQQKDAFCPLEGRGQRSWAASSIVASATSHPRNRPMPCPLPASRTTARTG